MHIVDQMKFLIGILAAVIGIAVLVTSRRTRGFGQRKQTAALLLFVAVIFIAAGLGYNLRALLGR